MRRWLPDEDRVLLDLYASGAPRSEIAQKLARTVDAVDARRRALGHQTRDGARPWQPREDEFVQAARAARIPASEVAPRLGRSVEAVRYRSRKLAPLRPASRRYTTTEDAFLREQWNGGSNMLELATTIGRSPDALRLRARELGIAQPLRRKRWTGEEDKRLREGYSRGMTCRSIAETLLPTRTPGAVTARAGLLALALHGRRWTDTDTQTLAESARCGYSIEEIARRLERSVDAVRQRCAKLGLPTPSPNHHYPNRGKPWSAADDTTLRQAPAADLHELSQLVGRSEQAVRRRLAYLGLRGDDVRSPHRAPPNTNKPSAAERRVAQQALALGSARFLAVARRLGRTPDELRRDAPHALSTVSGAPR